MIDIQGFNTSDIIATIIISIIGSGALSVLIIGLFTKYGKFNRRNVHQLSEDQLKLRCALDNLMQLVETGQLAITFEKFEKDVNRDRKNKNLLIEQAKLQELCHVIIMYLDYSNPKYNNLRILIEKLSNQYILLNKVDVVQYIEEKNKLFKTRNEVLFCISNYFAFYYSITLES